MLAIVVAALLPAAPALAEGAGHGGHGIRSLLWPAFNLALLLGVVFYFARKPVRDFFSERRASIQADLDESAALQRRAEERYSQWQRRLADLDAELASIRDTARQRAESEGARILDDARAAAERIRKDASSAIAQELRRAETRLRAEASELAIELAAKLLREQVDDSDRSRLLDDFIARVESAPERSAREGR